MTRDQSDQPPDQAPRLELSYPCAYRYRVIGTDAARLRAALASVAGDADHSIHEGNTSRAGTYRSLELVVTVRDDEHRRRVFAQLAGHEDVRFVL